MQRIVMWVASTATIVTLLFGYRTSTQGRLDLTDADGAQSPVISASGNQTGSQVGSGAGANTDSGSDAGSASGTAANNADQGSGGTNAGRGSSSRVVTGESVYTRYGPVQVELTVKGTTITSIRMLSYPYTSPRDQQINTAALPILISETLDAQDANIDMVSGATYTSEGYRQSLQSALDQL